MGNHFGNRLVYSAVGFHSGHVFSRSDWIKSQVPRAREWLNAPRDVWLRLCGFSGSRFWSITQRKGWARETTSTATTARQLSRLRNKRLCRLVLLIIGALAWVQRTHARTQRQHRYKTASDFFTARRINDALRNRVYELCKFFSIKVEQIYKAHFFHSSWKLFPSRFKYYTFLLLR